MGAKTKIQWTADGATWTPIRARNLETGKIGWHCEHATTGCEFCYAEGMNKRFGTGLPFKPGHRKDIEIFLDEKMLLAPLRWKKPRMIFLCSMTDAFADFVQDEWLDKMFAVMAMTPQHTYQILTKRAERMKDYCKQFRVLGRGFDIVDQQRKIVGGDDNYFRRQKRTDGYGTGFTWPLSQCWMGVSTERQQEAEERIPLLLDTPAAVRFISAEPLLAPIDLAHLKLTEPNELTVFRTINALTGRRGHGGKFGYTETCDPLQHRLDWAIIGGESGHGARPMNLEWARSLRDQCTAAGVSFFMKQIDGRQPIPADLMVRQFPNRNAMAA